MELNITHFFNNANPRELSGSVAELGKDAGAITWGNAVYASGDYNILDTAEKVQAVKNHIRGYGAWSDEEINGWLHSELTALLLQLIASEMRETGLDDGHVNWEEYEASENAGRIFKGIDGEIYYYAGE